MSPSEIQQQCAVGPKAAPVPLRHSQYPSACAARLGNTAARIGIYFVGWQDLAGCGLERLRLSDQPHESTHEGGAGQPRDDPKEIRP